MPRPVHFEIHASEPTVLRAFYESVFGWTFTQWGEVPYWLVTTGSPEEPGIDGGMLPRNGNPAEEGQAVNAWVVTVDVPDCQAYLDRAVAAGGRVAMPMTATPGIGWLAYVKDPDGNILGLMQNDPTAA
jgi:predicted enzyme related to lactoylglutathione lyase